MSTLTVVGQQAEFKPEQVDLIKKTICKGASDDELKLFLAQCARTRLDPFSRQIYSIQRKQKIDGKYEEKQVIQVSIDGFRVIAERSEKYAGQVGPFWCGDDGVWKDVWLSNKQPAAAKVGVLRSDFSDTLWGVARFSSYAGTYADGNYTTMWAKMGDVMIAKVAEALALRKAFPQDLSGLYTTEEMNQADEKVETSEPKKSASISSVVDQHAPVVQLKGLLDSDPEDVEEFEVNEMPQECVTQTDMKAFLFEMESAYKQNKYAVYRIAANIFKGFSPTACSYDQLEVLRQAVKDEAAKT